MKVVIEPSSKLFNTSNRQCFQALPEKMPTLSAASSLKDSSGSLSDVLSRWLGF